MTPKCLGCGHSCHKSTDVCRDFFLVGDVAQKCACPRCHCESCQFDRAWDEGALSQKLGTPDYKGGLK